MCTLDGLGIGIREGKPGSLEKALALRHTDPSLAPAKCVTLD